MGMGEEVEGEESGMGEEISCIGRAESMVEVEMDRVSQGTTQTHPVTISRSPVRRTVIRESAELTHPMR